VIWLLVAKSLCPADADVRCALFYSQGHGLTPVLPSLFANGECSILTLKRICSLMTMRPPARAPVPSISTPGRMPLEMSTPAFRRLCISCRLSVTIRCVILLQAPIWCLTIRLSLSVTLAWLFFLLHSSISRISFVRPCYILSLVNQPCIIHELLILYTY